MTRPIINQFLLKDALGSSQEYRFSGLFAGSRPGPLSSDPLTASSFLEVALRIVWNGAIGPSPPSKRGLDKRQVKLQHSRLATLPVSFAFMILPETRSG